MFGFYPADYVIKDGFFLSCLPAEYVMSEFIEREGNRRPRRGGGAIASDG